MSYRNVSQTAPSACFCGHQARAHYGTPDAYTGTLSSTPLAVGVVVITIGNSNNNPNYGVTIPVPVTLGMTAPQFVAALIKTLAALSPLLNLGGFTASVSLSNPNNFVITPYGSGPYGTAFTVSVDTTLAFGAAITNVSPGFVQAGCALCPDHHALAPEPIVYPK